MIIKAIKCRKCYETAYLPAEYCLCQLPSVKPLLSDVFIALAEAAPQGARVELYEQTGTYTQSFDAGYPGEF